jgi:hypothetical protein
MFGALVLSCTIQSFMVWTHQAAAMAPYEIGTSVGNTKPGTGDSPKRGDSAIPEIRIVDDKNRTPNGYAVTVSDSISETQERSEFPSNF